MEKIIDLNSFANGAVSEKVNIELQKVLENIADPNTDPKKVRKVTVVISLKPNETRNVADISVTTKSTIVPAQPIGTSLLIDMDREGNATGSELKSGVPGQMYMDEQGEVLNDKGEKPNDPEIKATDNKVVSFK